MSVTVAPITEETKQKLILAFADMLGIGKEIRISNFRRAIEIEPKYGLKQFRPDETSYMLVVTGPRTDFEEEVLNMLRDYCGH